MYYNILNTNLILFMSMKIGPHCYNSLIPQYISHLLNLINMNLLLEYDQSLFPTILFLKAYLCSAIFLFKKLTQDHHQIYHIHILQYWQSA